MLHTVQSLPMDYFTGQNCDTKKMAGGWTETEYLNGCSVDTVGDISCVVVKQEDEEVCNSLFHATWHCAVATQSAASCALAKQRSVLGAQKDLESLCMISCNRQDAGWSHTISTADRAVWGVLPVDRGKGMDACGDVWRQELHGFLFSFSEARKAKKLLQPCSSAKDSLQTVPRVQSSSCCYILGFNCCSWF